MEGKRLKRLPTSTCLNPVCQKGKAFPRSLPSKQRSTVTKPITALKTAFDNPNGNGSREVQAHGSAVPELHQGKGKPTAKHSRRARRISKYMGPRYDHLLVAKRRDGFRSKSSYQHLSSAGVSRMFSFKVYRRFLDLGRIDHDKRKKARSFGSSSEIFESISIVTPGSDTR